MASTQNAWVFDQIHYLKHIEARGALIRELVPKLHGALGLTTALDAGCGPGFFSQILTECKLEVLGFDGREVNIDQARKRYPQIRFETRDIDDSSVVRLGLFDLVLCFGLLYHLENPLRAIRHLRSLTGKVLLLESMCLPSEDPFVLLREEPKSDDQSLTDLAFYPSEGCIVKMLYRSGFSSVYRIASLPDHDDFRDTPEHTRLRTVILAAYEPLKLPGLIELQEPHETAFSWTKTPRKPTKLARAWQFLKKPLSHKFMSLSIRLSRLFPNIPTVLLLPFGAWWLARNDHIGQPIREGRFEPSEVAFVQKLLRPGMTVLDIGAHHGLYTLLASKCVGPTGKVCAFEPSPRERRALLFHVKLNLCRNVTVQRLALGNEETETELYVVEGSQTGCNSLRPPIVVSGTSTVHVEVTRLDRWLQNRKIDRVDFVKLDVEGAELTVLEGAKQLLDRRPRPVILAEVQDIRTLPWGYGAKEILNHLVAKGYKWFSLSPDGSADDLDMSLASFDGNFVAWPEEREREFRDFIASGS